VTDTDITQRRFGEIVNEQIAFLNRECENDIQLMTAVLRDSLFQLELSYRVRVLDMLAERNKP
jgi:hypothetical protein